ncbi:hypothetical protein BRC97_02325 [Halobacteriales archaeon QS_6_71_20]|nr:MAG: hypothetical protein BRC97_02325 [Halobacteriales archaeon QS_6_71_20]
MRRRHALRAGAAALGAGVIGSPAAGVVSARSDDEDGYGPIGAVEVDGTREAVVSDDGRTAFLALGDGYATVDVSDPAAPAVLAERRDPLADREDGPFRLVHDVKLSGDRLVAVGPAHPGRESPHGVLVVDVSDPADPVETGFHGTAFPIHNCFLDGRHCYLTGNGARGNPLVVVDVAAHTEVARWSLFDRDDAWADVAGGLRTLHDVTVRDGVAALSYWDAGTYLLDVSTPSEPVHVGTVDAGDPADLRAPRAREGVVPPGNHHHSLLFPGGDVLAVGRETWAVERDGDVVGGPSGVDLYDVSAPDNPVRLSSVAPPPTPDPTFGGTWTTAHNFAVREDTLYTAWYQGGVKRHDVSEPANPVEETWWADPEAARFWAATPAVPGEFLVAPSMGTRGAPAGLWTFPDAPGTGGDRSRLSADAARATADATPGETTEPSVTPTATPSSTESPTPTASRAAGPGFGAGSAVAGLGSSLALALRRLRRDD